MKLALAEGGPGAACAGRGAGWAEARAAGAASFPGPSRAARRGPARSRYHHLRPSSQLCPAGRWQTPGQRRAASPHGGRWGVDGCTAARGRGPVQPIAAPPPGLASSLALARSQRCGARGGGREDPRAGPPAPCGQEGRGGRLPPPRPRQLRQCLRSGWAPEPCPPPAWQAWPVPGGPCMSRPPPLPSLWCCGESALFGRVSCPPGPRGWGVRPPPRGGWASVRPRSSRVPAGWASGGLTPGSEDGAGVGERAPRVSGEAPLEGAGSAGERPQSRGGRVQRGYCSERAFLLPPCTCWPGDRLHLLPSPLRPPCSHGVLRCFSPVLDFIPDPVVNTVVKVRASQGRAGHSSLWGASLWICTHVVCECPVATETNDRKLRGSSQHKCVTFGVRSLKSVALGQKQGVCSAVLLLGLQGRFGFCLLQLLEAARVPCLTAPLHLQSQCCRQPFSGCVSLALCPGWERFSAQLLVRLDGLIPRAVTVITSAKSPLPSAVTTHRFQALRDRRLWGPLFCCHSVCLHVCAPTRTCESCFVDVGSRSVHLKVSSSCTESGKPPCVAGGPVAPLSLPISLFLDCSRLC